MYKCPNCGLVFERPIIHVYLRRFGRSQEREEFQICPKCAYCVRNREFPRLDFNEVSEWIQDV